MFFCLKYLLSAVEKISLYILVLSFWRRRKLLGKDITDGRQRILWRVRAVQSNVNFRRV